MNVNHTTYSYFLMENRGECSKSKINYRNSKPNSQTWGALLPFGISQNLGRFYNFNARVLTSRRRLCDLWLLEFSVFVCWRWAGHWAFGLDSELSSFFNWLLLFQQCSRMQRMRSREITPKKYNPNIHAGPLGLPQGPVGSWQPPKHVVSSHCGASKG